MTKRDIIKTVLDHGRPPYVPWSLRFTFEAKERLKEHFGPALETELDDHFLELGSDIGFFEELPDNRFRDVFGVTWNRTVDKDIGNVEGCVLPEPRFSDYAFPDPLDKRFFADIEDRIQRHGDRFRVFCIGFSLFERAWTLRGMETLLMDFYDNPEFVTGLFEKIADYNIAQIKKALQYDIDAVYFGDDWGQQRGLIMGPKIWRQFIKPVLKRMYTEVKSAGKYVLIHSCGDVDELFDDLVEIGLDCFNPFQPEVMDTDTLLEKYRGILSFHGGLSTQKILPYGSVDDVRRRTRHLIEAGGNGGYIFSPAHAVEGDVCLENMLAFIEEIKNQAGYRGAL
jgi:uroporphyrinogen decarboxylase